MKDFALPEQGRGWMLLPCNTTAITGTAGGIGLFGTTPVCFSVLCCWL
jgi:hypothetical protein